MINADSSTDHYKSTFICNHCKYFGDNNNSIESSIATLIHKSALSIENYRMALILSDSFTDHIIEESSCISTLSLIIGAQDE